VFGWNIIECGEYLTKHKKELFLSHRAVKHIIIIIIVIVVMAVQPFVGPCQLFQFLDPIQLA
jgi:hypothetical protein